VIILVRLNGNIVALDFSDDGKGIAKENIASVLD
jgi:chemotaxis protein histidine kinase CheA